MADDQKPAIDWETVALILAGALMAAKGKNEGLAILYEAIGLATDEIK